MYQRRSYADLDDSLARLTWITDTLMGMGQEEASAFINDERAFVDRVNSGIANIEADLSFVLREREREREEAAARLLVEEEGSSRGAADWDTWDTPRGNTRSLSRR